MKHIASWLKATNKFLGLPFSEKRILVEAAILLWAARLGLWVIPTATLRSFADKRAPILVEHRERNSFSQDQLIWAIEAMSCYVPEATCLTKALAAKMLLTRFGYISSLHIGVAKSEDDRLEAHAWLEQEGMTIVGKVDRDYPEILSWGNQDP
jgi:hypothetical protein